MQIIKSCLPLILVVLIVSCAQGAATPAPTGTLAPSGATNTLAKTQWKLVSLGAPGAETPVVPETEITLQFSADGQAAGNSGCNQYGSDYTVRDNQLTFGSIVSTERACLDQRIMQQETQYLNALQASGKFEQTAERLKLTYDNGQGVLNFIYAQTLAPTPETTRSS